jgi:hypothetical protein
MKAKTTKADRENFLSVWLKVELELDRFLDMGFLWLGNMTEEMIAWGDDNEMKRRFLL